MSRKNAENKLFLGVSHATISGDFVSSSVLSEKMCQINSKKIIVYETDESKEA